MNSLSHPLPTQLVFGSDPSARAFRKRQSLQRGVRIWSASSTSAKQNVRTKPKSPAQVKVSLSLCTCAHGSHLCSNENTHSSGLTGCPHKRFQAASIPGDWQAHREPLHQVLQVSNMLTQFVEHLVKLRLYTQCVYDRALIFRIKHHDFCTWSHVLTQSFWQDI